ncbi:transmembrane emp24 domain-containing protein 1 [Daphnia magna]|uniref:Opossum n=2 Tax=Daphnia magna TaxID=35525 RepID=A0A164QMI3_9CRUS|nr:transmembrane emp24 domain-containing protein 1 [Daphnia magna]KAK4002957.1 hypothetical protein OUZ56_004749 [Daphnia magna]KZS07889.1 Opossum [Daphnia magna]
MRTIVLLLVFVLLVLSSVVVAYSNEFTITVDPGKEDCYYTPVAKNVYLEVDYQVIDGQQGELDIDFHLTSPTGRRIVMESRKSDSTHRTKTFEDGDHKICFDNTFSIFSAKTVFFEISTDNDDDEDDNGEIKIDKKNNDVWGDTDQAFYAGLRPEEIYDIHVQDIKDTVATVRGKLTRAQEFQDQIRAFEARDRNIAEGNFTRVNFWSMIHVITLVTTGIIQVVMVRSLFDEKSTLRRLWKQGKM